MYSDWHYVGMENVTRATIGLLGNKSISTHTNTIEFGVVDVANFVFLRNQNMHLRKIDTRPSMDDQKRRKGPGPKD